MILISQLSIIIFRNIVNIPFPIVLNITTILILMVIIVIIIIIL